MSHLKHGSMSRAISYAVAAFAKAALTCVADMLGAHGIQSLMGFEPFDRGGF